MLELCVALHTQEVLVVLYGARRADVYRISSNPFLIGAPQMLHGRPAAGLRQARARHGKPRDHFRGRGIMESLDLL